jgi:acyl-CoA thioesterase FadM
VIDREHDIQVRWPDLDGLGHVNHSAVLVYLEVGRDATLRSAGITPEQYVVRHCEVSYHRQVRPGDRCVRYRCDGMQPGRTSIRTTERLLDLDGFDAVAAEFTLVMWDPTCGEPRPLTDRERTHLSGSTTEEKTA